MAKEEETEENNIERKYLKMTKIEKNAQNVFNVGAEIFIFSVVKATFNERHR
jgi:hypothetical protein